MALQPHMNLASVKKDNSRLAFWDINNIIRMRLKNFLRIVFFFGTVICKECFEL